MFEGLWSIKRKSTEQTTPDAGRPQSRWSPLFQEGFRSGGKTMATKVKLKKKKKDTSGKKRD
ncbi:hypothetical protein EXN66_Car018727 [Channa argus]|uniref:Uncharacterized protein n=1 Tax=Channa argus TaxID=215402 RepID=A0A6G1QKY3_CHAAH|nr:hypothetical protein EXN66_Car018727 [Channa argus]